MIDKQIRSNIVNFFLILASIFLMILPQIYLWNHTVDDSYITYRYVERFVRGLGLTFNDNEKVEGYSNFLWVIILSIFRFTTPFKIETLGRVLGIAFALGQVIFIYKSSFSLAINDIQQRKIFTLASWVIILCPSFHVYATSGMEVALFSFLLSGGVYFSIAEKNKCMLIAAVFFGMLGITRPEGFLYAFLWFIFTIRKFEKSVLRFELYRFALTCVPTVILLVFRINYYNEFLPNTTIAKIPGIFGNNPLNYLEPFVVSLGSIYGLLIMVVLAYIHKIYKFKKLAIYFRSILGSVIACLIFVFYAKGDWMPFGRFVAPTWFSLTVGLSTVICHLIEKIYIRWSVKFKYIIVIIIFTILSIIAWVVPIRKYINNESVGTLMRGTKQIVVGKWIIENLPQNTTIATRRLGGIGFMAINYVIWDFYGLTDKEEAIFIKNGKLGVVENDPILKRNPDVIVAADYLGDGVYHSSKEFSNYLKKYYTFIKSFPQDNFGSLDIFVRKERFKILNEKIKKCRSK